MKDEKKSPPATWEEVLAAAKQMKTKLDDRRVFEIRARRAGLEIDSLSLRSDLTRDAICLTINLLNKKVRLRLNKVAKELHEDPQSLYFLMASEVEPNMSIDTLIELLEDQDKLTEFLGKIHLQRVQELKEQQLKGLRLRWRSRLLAPAKHVLNDCLEGEYGRTFEPGEDELINAARLSQEAFRKKEKDEWLPKMRELLDTCKVDESQRLRQPRGGMGFPGSQSRRGRKRSVIAHEEDYPKLYEIIRDVYGGGIRGEQVWDDAARIILKRKKELKLVGGDYTAGALQGIWKRGKQRFSH